MYTIQGLGIQYYLICTEDKCGIGSFFMNQLPHLQ